MESSPPTADALPLAQPTRARLLDLLEELDGPATSEELAARLSRHRSGVRVHLERLEAAGLVERRRVRQARGLREVEAAGRRLGQRLSPGDAELPLEDRFQQVFDALGFEPLSRPAAGGGVCFELGNCPYRSAVRANQPVVCTLHRGLTQGLLDRLAPHAALRSFVPKDPDSAGCLIEIGTDAPPADTGEPL
jgi:predicted ArsR family transcriptional regulator